MNDSAFLVTNASGRHINLLNDNQQEQPPVLFAAPSPPSSEVSDETSPNDIPVTTSLSKRKYHCTEPGCTKSFTTSGHLARHNRIHTGEKNFPCLFPGCQSRFSRQDNMMQHYRTHMSPKSRRTQQKKVISEDLHPRPKLHAHQRIRSDPYRVERPLTIDQHLNNYKRSLLSTSTTSSIRYNMPTPLGSVAASHMQKQQQKQNSGSVLNANGTWSIEPVSHQATPAIEEEDNTMEEDTTEVADYTPSPPTNTFTSDTLFYQHRPLTFNSNVSFLPFTLLHPTRVMSSPPIRIQKENHITSSPPLLSSTSTSSSSISTTATLTATTTDNNNNNSSSSSSSSQAGLLQLAHIVSTFG